MTPFTNGFCTSLFRTYLAWSFQVPLWLEWNFRADPRGRNSYLGTMLVDVKRFVGIPDPPQNNYFKIIIIIFPFGKNI